MNCTQILCFGLYVASLGLNAAQVTGSGQMFSDTAAKALSDYKATGSADAISRVVPELKLLAKEESKTADGQKSVLSVCASALNALYERADVKFDPNKKPALNSEFPGGKYRAGIDPASVKDPKLRAEYETVIAKDRTYATYYGKQYEISQAIDDLSHLLRETFESMKPNDIGQALADRGMRASFAEDLVGRLERSK